MKRDLELCLEILAAVERQPTSNLTTIGIEGREFEEVAYHLMLLKEAGFVEAELVGGANAHEALWQTRRLTWAGHDYLERERTIRRNSTAGGRR